MTTNTHREPAKIYTFPSGGRSRLGGFVSKQMSAEEFSAKRIMPTDFGSGWYHDTAITEDRDAN